MAWTNVCLADDMLQFAQLSGLKRIVRLGVLYMPNAAMVRKQVEHVQGKVFEQVPVLGLCERRGS